MCRWKISSLQYRVSNYLVASLISKVLRVKIPIYALIFFFKVTVHHEKKSLFYIHLEKNTWKEGGNTWRIYTPAYDQSNFGVTYFQLIWIMKCRWMTNINVCICAQIFIIQRINQSIKNKNYHFVYAFLDTIARHARSLKDQLKNG